MSIDDKGCEHESVIVFEEMDKSKNHRLNGTYDDLYRMAYCEDCKTTLLRTFKDYERIDERTVEMYRMVKKK